MCSQETICDVCSIETNLQSPTQNDEFRCIRSLACVMKSAEQQNARMALILAYEIELKKIHCLCVYLSQHV
jgi:hypothetical protein